MINMKIEDLLKIIDYFYEKNKSLNEESDELIDGIADRLIYLEDSINEIKNKLNIKYELDK